MGQFYLRNEFFLAAAQLAFAVLGIGATLTLKDFKALIMSPRSLVICMAVQMLLPISIVFVLLNFDALPPALLVGLALCAVAPGGSTSSLFTYVAKGNATLAIAVTVLTSFASLVNIPFFLGRISPEYVGSDFHVPTGRLLSEMVFFLLVPLVAGMALAGIRPQLAPKVSKWSIRCSLFIILVMVVGALNSGRMNLQVFGLRNIVTVVSFLLFHVALALVLVRSLRVPREDIIAICMENGVRNGSLALLLKASLFPAQSIQGPDLILFTVLFYTGLQTPLALVITYLGRRSGAIRQEAPQGALS